MNIKVWHKFLSGPAGTRRRFGVASAWGRCRVSAGEYGVGALAGGYHSMAMGFRNLPHIS